MKRDLPIAVFDSGLGGMSLLAELIRVLPNESFLYFGDTANAPYGTRSEDDVKRLTEQNLEYLLSLGIKAFVIACNTATSAAAAYLREKHKDLIIIGIEPALKPVTLCEGSPTVAVLATPLTLKGDKFAALLAKHSLTVQDTLRTVITQDRSIMKAYSIAILSIITPIWWIWSV